MDDIIKRDSSNSLKNVSHMKEKMCLLLAWFTIKDLMNIICSGLTHKLLVFVKKTIAVL